jgi:hypothetical protein
MKDAFIDPRLAFTYEWHIGHETEASIGKKRNISHSANSQNTGLVRQQGDVSPLILKYEGKILHLKQYEEMWRFYELCETQTIYYRDYMGEEYEVLITEFSPQRTPTVKNPKDFANAPRHFWKYTIEMEVVRVISGALSGLSP